MKILKKTLSVFLATLMFLSALSVSLVAFAADNETDALYRNLAYSFFSYKTVTSGFDTKFVVNIDENGYPIKSLVGDMNQYEVSNESDNYKYSDTDGSPIRAVAYNHKVTAKDDDKATIRKSLMNYLGLVDAVMSKQYGVGDYTIPMIAKDVASNLKFIKGDDGEYLFLDGYTYLTDSYGNIVGRSEEKTYEVVDGEIKYFATDDEDTDWRDVISGGGNIRDLLAQGSVNKITLYDYCNVDSVLAYFSGNCTTVNSGNWFHTFEFEVYTDLETILLNTELTAAPFTERDTVVKWTMNRQYDESGTKAQYYNNGYEITTDTYKTNTTRKTLTDLKSNMDNYFVKYYKADVLPNTTNQQIINSYYGDIRSQFGTFDALSNEAKIAAFGQSAFSYVNLVTQLTPIVDPTNIDKYLPSHTYEKYQDKNGNNVVYKVTTEKVTTVVSTIDDLLKSERVGAIIKTFFDFSDPKYEGKAFYGVEANTAQEVLVQVIQNFVFDDSIINMLLGMLYPMVSNLIDANLNDALITNAVGGTVADLLTWVTEGSDGWQALIYGLLLGKNIGLTPAGVGYCMRQAGYNAKYPAIVNALIAAKGGTLTKTAQTQNFGVYAIGKENDEYMGNRWRDADTDSYYWGINGDRAKFQQALCAILSPLAPLLAVLLGDQRMEIFVGDAAVDLYLVLKNLDLYDDVLLGLLEALGVTDLITPAAFRNLAGALNGSYTTTNVENFLNKGLLNPLLDWLMNEVLADPISIVLTLLPNVSYYLTSGALLATLNALEIPIGLKVRSNLGFNYYDGTVYTLKLADLLGDKLAFLDSLQGILDLIGIKVNTGIPYVGYHAENDDKVYKPGMAGYNEQTTTIGVTEAYANANGDMLTYQNDEYTTLITGLDEDGNPNDNAIYNQIGWANSAGNVVLERNDTTATEAEYNIPVYKYYEYTVTDEETGENMLYRKTTPPTDVEFNTVIDPVCETVKAKLPAIMDYKLQACGTVKQLSSVREQVINMTAKDGSTVTWNAGVRYGVDMHVAGEESEGLVLLYIFRYLFSALKYRAYDADTQAFLNDYTLLDAFGLGDSLDKELVAGLKLSDIINNIALHPDEAIAALYELFYKNEFGAIWEVIVTENTRTMVTGSDYSYGLDYVNYYTDEIIGNAEEHDDYNYGTTVLYTEYWSREDSGYVIDNLDNIVDDVLAMLKLENIDSLGAFLDGLLTEKLFNNDMVSNLVGMLYGLLDGMNGVDLSTILNAALDVDYSKRFLYEALAYEFDGIKTDVYKKLYADYNASEPDYKYTKDYFYKMGIDEETGEDVRIEPLDWGFNNPEVTAKYTPRQIFIRAISAALSPFAVLVRFLFGGEDLSVLGLINIPGYEDYHYAWIPFMEALGATRGLIPFDQFFSKVFVGDGTNKDENIVRMSCDAFYYSFMPAFNFVEDLIQDPVSILLGMLPNLLFFFSIGGLNDIINNFVHFAYVLLDILKPVLDVYPILNGLLSNIRIGSFALNLSLPLDLDINQLVNSLIDGLLGDLLTFDIENKNIQLGEKQVEEEVFVPDLDQNGEEVLDENGKTMGHTEMQTVTKPVYAVGTLKITLPYIDLATICAGTVQERVSISGERYVYLNASGGADLLTILLRLITETLFYKDNAINIADFLIGFCQLDDEDDNDELLMEIFTYLNDEAHANDLPDKTMKLLFTVYKVLVPIADNLGARFKKVDFSITEMFGDMDNITYYVNALLNAGDSTNPTLTGFQRLIQLIKQFFAKLKAFFQSIFKKG